MFQTHIRLLGFGLVSYFKCISALTSVVRRQWEMFAVNISAKHRYLIFCTCHRKPTIFTSLQKVSTIPWCISTPLDIYDEICVEKNISILKASAAVCGDKNEYFRPKIWSVFNRTGGFVPEPNQSTKTA